MTSLLVSRQACVTQPPSAARIGAAQPGAAVPQARLGTGAKGKRRQVAALQRRLAFLAVAVLAVAGAAWAPPNPAAQPVQKVDLTGANRERKTTFQADGLAMEVVREFSMAGQKVVRIEAAFPDPGDFKVELTSPDSQVDVRNVRSSGRQGTAEVVSRFSRMDLKGAERRAKEMEDRLWKPLEKKFRPEADKMNRNQLVAWLQDHQIDIPMTGDEAQKDEQYRKTYTGARVLETIGPSVRDRLAELAERKPKWFSAEDRSSWEKKNGRALLEIYHELATYDVIDEYLKELGCGVETTRTGYKRRLSTRLEAVHHVLSGDVGKGVAVSAGLTPAEQSRLRAAISVTLACRFYPAADPHDLNSQWFNGQRAGCRAKGVASIRLQGRLDPANHDRVDWWRLEDYNPQTARLEYARSPAFHVEQYPVEGGVRVRVVAAGEKPVDYALELRPVPASSGKINVVVHESSASGGRKFPY